MKCMTILSAIGLAAPLLAASCSSSPASGGEASGGEASDKVASDLSAPTLTIGKADVQGYTAKGSLAFGEPRPGKLQATAELHGYELSVRAGAPVKLEITHKGSSAKLDSVLFVYPPLPAGGFAELPVAQDDDSGWGRLSKLTHTFEAQGSYLVVVGSYLGLGKGTYRLEATCLASDCAPMPEAPICEPAVLDRMKECATELRMPELPETLRPPTPVEIVERCTEAELLGPTYDELCAGEPLPTACSQEFFAFVEQQIALCGPELLEWAKGTDCVFGATYSAIAQNTAWYTTETARRLIASADALSELEREQLMAAVASSALGPFSSPKEAIAATDDDAVEQIQLWDMSNERGFTAYGFHAGDTRLGLVFEAGTMQVAARINDTFIEDCAVLAGPRLAPCATKADCAPGLMCVGAEPQTFNGRCVDNATDYPGDGQLCGPGDDNPCPPDAGVGCAGTGYDGTGICLPLWMRGVFQDITYAPIPDGPTGVLARVIQASGLLTVTTDARLRVYLTHPDVSQLRITLANPYDTEAVVYDGEATGTDLWLEEAVPVPGDEMANGAWTLRVYDTHAGTTGTLVSWVLWLGSRWD